MKETTTIHTVPVHVAIVMDGNRRWAKKRGLPTIEGHRKGAKVAGEVIEACGKAGVRYLTLYALSVENLQRPPHEVAMMMELLEFSISAQLKHLIAHNVVLKISGDLAQLPLSLQEKLRHAVAATAHNQGLILIMALAYGSQQEITTACQRLAAQVQKGTLLPEDITPTHITQHLYVEDVPPPDMLIRTSGEYRISNFLLWQLSYSELFFVPTLWPDFTEMELLRLLVEYTKRERRYGLRIDDACTTTPVNNTDYSHEAML